MITNTKVPVLSSFLGGSSTPCPSRPASSITSADSPPWRALARTTTSHRPYGNSKRRRQSGSRNENGKSPRHATSMAEVPYPAKIQMVFWQPRPPPGHQGLSRHITTSNCSAFRGGAVGPPSSSRGTSSSQRILRGEKLEGNIRFPTDYPPPLSINGYVRDANQF